jgi:hypothetical protein
VSCSLTGREEAKELAIGDLSVSVVTSWGRHTNHKLTSLRLLCRWLHQLEANT